jgi:hypothetical protein
MYSKVWSRVLRDVADGVSQPGSGNLCTPSRASSMPPIDVPKSCSTVSVSIIDTTAWAYKIPCETLFYPRFKGLKTFDLYSHAFLITHEHHDSKRRLLFDLGIRKDWQNLVPDMVQKLKKWGTEYRGQGKCCG